MKDILKAIKLLALGLLSSVFIYPLLHELGHSVFALCSGAKIVDFVIFPLPSVLCDFDHLNTSAVVLTGLGGALFPFGIARFLPTKRFAGWFVRFVIDGICALSFVISIVAIILFQIGKPIENEDMTKIMSYTPQYATMYYALFVALMLVSFVSMAKSNPIKRCLLYFDIKK